MMSTLTNNTSSSDRDTPRDAMSSRKLLHRVAGRVLPVPQLTRSHRELRTRFDVR